MEEETEKIQYGLHSVSWRPSHTHTTDHGKMFPASYFKPLVWYGVRCEQRISYPVTASDYSSNDLPSDQATRRTPHLGNQQMRLVCKGCRFRKLGMLIRGDQPAFPMRTFRCNSSNVLILLILIIYVSIMIVSSVGDKQLDYYSNASLSECNSVILLKVYRKNTYI